MTSSGTPRAARWARPTSELRRTRSWSVARSEMSTTRSVFITLWMSGMCLSPIPWMLCSPKPLRSIVGHSRASTATIFVPWRSFSQSPARDRPRRSGGRDERRGPEPGLPVGQRLHDPLEGTAGHRPVDEVVPVLAELVEDDVGRVLRQHGAGVVDLLDVALRADRPDDVLGRDHPLLEPVEALLAHPLGEDRHAAAGEDPRDRHAAAAVVAGRRPDRALGRGVELAGHEARDEAGVGRQDLVGGDHREAVAEGDDDRRLDAGERPAAGRRDPPPGRSRAGRPSCSSGRGRGCGRRGHPDRRSRGRSRWTPGSFPDRRAGRTSAGRSESRGSAGRCARTRRGRSARYPGLPPCAAPPGAWGRPLRAWCHSGRLGARLRAGRHASPLRRTLQDSPTDGHRR